MQVELVLALQPQCIAHTTSWSERRCASSSPIRPGAHVLSSRLAPCTRIALNVVACLGGLEQGGIRYWRHTENAIKAR
ncbi:hypothetical protein TcWFU_006979 [Taenia crassiceps]|uniref:Uncharacterized protein n=1 Tax=Taenia crassiceps TaxID=6207 RepID=A0ABR4QIC2_9CEST